MNTIWTPVVVQANVSQACLLSTAAFPAVDLPASSSFCVFRVPAQIYASTCCLQPVIVGEDACTYICPNGDPSSILACMHTILGTRNPIGMQTTSSAQTILSGARLQMSCYDASTGVFMNSTIGDSDNDLPPFQRQGTFINQQQQQTSSGNVWGVKKSLLCISTALVAILLTG